MTITTLFIDIGGVLLTNGWDQNARRQVAGVFQIDFAEMESRHKLMVDLLEIGKISLHEYLKMVVFFKKRSFLEEQFRECMFEQSKPFPEMIELIAKLKARHGLKVVVVSNEGRELTEYRIKKFKLGSFIDYFISSCFVGIRKPDRDIYQATLDVSQVNPDQVLYIEDRPMFLEVALSLGIKGLHHIDFRSTSAQLSKVGLSV